MARKPSRERRPAANTRTPMVAVREAAGSSRLEATPEEREGCRETCLPREGKATCTQGKTEARGQSVSIGLHERWCAPSLHLVSFPSMGPACRFYTGEKKVTHSQVMGLLGQIACRLCRKCGWPALFEETKRSPLRGSSFLFTSQKPVNRYI